nr:nuclear receptor-interacting protein 3 isoform X1 [Anas platyrhynchos]
MRMCFCLEAAARAVCSACRLSVPAAVSTTARWQSHPVLEGRASTPSMEAFCSLLKPLADISLDAVLCRDACTLRWSQERQPHNILQRRLMETNLSKLRSSRGSWTPKSDISAQTNKLNQTKLGSSRKVEDEEFIVVSCQCAGKELKAVVDTGSQHNLMSSACLDRLGLKEHLEALPSEEEAISLPRNQRVIGQIAHLVLTVGAVRVECAALVVEDNEKSFSFGLQTLKSLKCVINMEKHQLVLGKTDRAEIPFVDSIGTGTGEHTLEA